MCGFFLVDDPRPVAKRQKEFLSKHLAERRWTQRQGKGPNPTRRRTRKKK